MIRIENVVMRIDFRQGITLDHLIMLEPAYEVIYKPFIFPGATVKDRHVSFLLFSSGRGVCAGGKSVEESVKAVNRLHKTLVERGWIRDLGIEVSVENIVASAKLGYTLDIKRIAETLEHTIYEPDIFPAVIYYHQSPRATMLIFRNGKLVITGVKSEDQAGDIYRQVANILTPAKLEEAQA